MISASKCRPLNSAGCFRRIYAKAYQTRPTTVATHHLISDAEGVSKPKRQIFDRALERLNVTPAHAVFVGDHPEVDVAGVRAAGMRAIWHRPQSVTNGRGGCRNRRTRRPSHVAEVRTEAAIATESVTSGGWVGPEPRCQNRSQPTSVRCEQAPPCGESSSLAIDGAGRVASHGGHARRSLAPWRLIVTCPPKKSLMIGNLSRGRGSYVQRRHRALLAPLSAFRRKAR